MHIDTVGTYTLQYTATDSCGNETIEEREVIVASSRTVLYTDGTFIINEKSTDIDANVAEHGVATNVYDPFDPNGATDAQKYNFAFAADRPWHSQSASVSRVEFGSSLAPTNMQHWFFGFRQCTVFDFDGLDTSQTVNMLDLFTDCYAVETLDVSSFDTSNVISMSGMFASCHALTSIIGLDTLNTSAVTKMSRMFDDCTVLANIDVSSFDTSNVTSMEQMFGSCYALTSLDLSSFNTANVTNTRQMFGNDGNLVTIIVTESLFVTSQITNSKGMFSRCSSLVGGEGFPFNSDYTDKMLARVDKYVTSRQGGYFTAAA